MSDRPDYEDQEAWVARAKAAGVSLWWLSRDFRDRIEDYREAITFAVASLIEARRLVPADLAADGSLHAWPGTADEQVQRLSDRWKQLGRLPVAGEVAFFATPEGLGKPQAPLGQPGLINLIDALAIQDDWVSNAAHDDISFLTMAEMVRDALPEEREADIRRETLRLIEPLLRAGALVPVTWGWQIGEEPFLRWAGDADSQLAQLGSQWPTDDFAPSPVHGTFFIGS